MLIPFPLSEKNIGIMYTIINIGRFLKATADSKYLLFVRRGSSYVFTVLLIILTSLHLSHELRSQTMLNCDGNSHRFTVDDGAYTDFIVPEDPIVFQIRLTAKGGDGGAVNMDGPGVNGCVGMGGGGALAMGVFRVGYDAGEIPPGSIIRLLPGDVGGSFLTAIDEFTIGAGGGGGSGFLVQTPGSEDWQVLLVAGGGGGGAASQDAAGSCLFVSPGGAGRAATSGGRIGFGGKGGRNGRGGKAGSPFTDLATGGGGGFSSEGTGFGCPDDRNSGGGKAGGIEGGNGGAIGNCTTIDASKIVEGGFGFGGGGAGSTEGGGGGGGYSGGGGGSTEPFPELSTGGGGGGSSFVHEMAQSSSITPGTPPSTVDKGFIEYQCIVNVRPSAKCKQADNPLIVAINAAGEASFEAIELDGGSTDLEMGALTFSASTTRFGCDALGLNSVSLTVTDDVNLSNSCQASVLIIDDIAPALSCPDVIEVNNDPGECLAVVDYLSEFTATDNCSASTTLSIPSGSAFPLGTTVVEISATDPSLNERKCTFAIQVTDAEPAIANCQNASIELDANGSASIQSDLLNHNSTDNCGIERFELSQSTFDCGNVGDNTVVMTVVDESGNESTCESIVKVSDISNPIVQTRDLVIQLDADGQARITPERVDLGSNDACGIASLTLDKEDFDCADLGSNVVTLTVKDNNGNSNSSQAIIRVEDSKAPIMNCPPDIAVLCDDSREPLNTGTPMISDNCGAFSVIFQDEDDAISCEDERLIRRTWTTTDPSENTSNCQQLITVLKDDILPVCTNCPTDITVSCERIPNVEDLILTDNCDPAPHWQLITESTATADGSCSEFEYTITRTFVISDRCGNSFAHVQTITVVDETSPIISCPADITVTCDVPDPDATGFATATDNCDPNLSFNFTDLVLEGDCDNFCIIERTWNTFDACGNTSSCLQIVTKTAAGLIEDALMEDIDGDGIVDPVVLGYSNHTLTLTAEATDCIIDFLPSALGPARAIPAGNVTLDPNTCNMGNIAVDAEGKITNPLLEEAILLAVNMRLNTSLGNMPLSSMDCEDMPMVLHFLGSNRNPNVADLADLGNKALSGVLGPNLMEGLRATMACVNRIEDLCGVQSPFQGEGSSNGILVNKFGLGNLPVLQSVKLFPNPATNSIHLNFEEQLLPNMRIRILHADGRTMETRQLPESSPERQTFSLAKYSAGVYLMQIELSDGTVFWQRFVVSRS